MQMKSSFCLGLCYYSSMKFRIFSINSDISFINLPIQSLASKVILSGSHTSLENLASCFTSLCLTFLVYKVTMMIVTSYSIYSGSSVHQ